jgi:hypothetical protein
MIREIYPDERWSDKEVTAVVTEAYKAAEGNYGEKEAQEWGEDFAWPDDIRVRDEVLAEKCGFSVEEMTRVQHASAAKDRLSGERIEGLVPENDPDRQRLLDLVEGMRVLTADDFAPSGKPPKMRALYKQGVGGHVEGGVSVYCVRGNGSTYCRDTRATTVQHCLLGT